jgi:hypothetical protein
MTASVGRTTVPPLSPNFEENWIMDGVSSQGGNTMIAKVAARVTGVNERNLYYPEEGKYTQSTLKIMDNDARIEGEITVREQLSLGAVYGIVINTDQQTTVLQKPSENESRVMAEVR